MTQSTPLSQEEKTLRDEFAMAALTGIMAVPMHEPDFQKIVRSSYEIANLMLESRKQ